MRYLIRLSVFLSPEEQDYLRYCNGSEQNENHFRMHQIVSSVALLHHAVSKPVRLLRTKLTPVHLIPVERRGARRLQEKGADGLVLVRSNWRNERLFLCNRPRKASQRLTLLASSETEESVAPPAPTSTITSAIFQ